MIPPLLSLLARLKILDRDIRAHYAYQNVEWDSVLIEQYQRVSIWFEHQRNLNYHDFDISHWTVPEWEIVDQFRILFQAEARLSYL